MLLNFCIVAHIFISIFFSSLLCVGLRETFTKGLGRAPLHYNKFLQPPSTNMFHFFFLCFLFIFLSTVLLFFIYIHVFPFSSFLYLTCDFFSSFFFFSFVSIPVFQCWAVLKWVTRFSDRFSIFHIENQLFSSWMKIFIRALLHNNYVNSISCQSNHACANLILILFSHLTKL